MAKVGAQRAAELTGRSKSTVQRAMNTGKLSFEVDENGRRLIDVSELDRAFGLAPQGGVSHDAQAVQNELEKAQAALDTERLRLRIRMLEDQLDTAQTQIADLREQRDQWQRQAQQVLLTSQYSQKQAEEYKGKLDEHQRQVAHRRQQAEAIQRQRAIAQAEQKAEREANAGKARPAPAQPPGKSFSGFVKKLRGQNGNQPAPNKSAAKTATKTAA